MTLIRATLSTLLSLSLTLGSTVALAAPAEEGVDAPAPEAGAPEDGPDTGATEAEKSRGEELSEQAIEAFNAKRFEEAVDLFKQAYDADPQPNYLFNIGRVYEEAGDFESAVEFYQKFVKQPGVDLESREFALERLKVLKGIIEETKGPEEKPPEETEGPEEKTEPPPPVDTEAQRKKKVMRGAGFGLIGVGAAALIGGAVSGGLAQGDNNSAAEAGTPEERRDLLASSQTKALAADVLYGVGGAVLLTGVILVAVGYAKPKSSSRVAFTPTFGPTGAGFDLRLRF